MFTGLVELMATISSIQPTTEFEGFSWVVSGAESLLADQKIGDSIAVNGCCLTVTEFLNDGKDFRMGLSNETLDRTNLGEIKEGDLVNLERAMSGSSRFGGHIVQGHIDVTATILSITPDGDSVRYLFALPLEFHRTLIPKGFIALDGTSLTLTTLAVPEGSTVQVPEGQGVFGVMLIAHTQLHTVVAKKKVGDTVNVECDIVGKGVESVVTRMLESTDSGGLLEAMVERAVERVLARKAAK